MDRIVKLSKWIKALLLLLALMQLGSYCALMLIGEYSEGTYSLTLDWWGVFHSFISVDLEPSWQALGADLYAAGFHPGLMLASVEMLPYLFIYFFLYRLFSLYQHNQVFTHKNFHYLNRIALVFFAWILLTLFYPMLVTLFMRSTGLADSIPGYFILGSQELKYALIGLIFYCIAWVMKQASELQQEAELTI
jgi:hypothetical protein